MRRELGFAWLDTIEMRMEFFSIYFNMDNPTKDSFCPGKDTPTFTLDEESSSISSSSCLCT